MKIYTKTGDKGETSLVGGTRVSKSDLKIDTFGNIDELNAWVGLLAEYTINEDQKPLLRKVQNNLFVIGGNLAKEPAKVLEKVPGLPVTEVEQLEKAIDGLNEKLSPQRYFILPGGHKEVAFAHVARTVCRRAERGVVRLSASEPVDDNILIYLNRLSDYLFVLCRDMCRKLDVQEVPWIP